MSDQENPHTTTTNMDPHDNSDSGLYFPIHAYPTEGTTSTSDTVVERPSSLTTRQALIPLAFVSLLFAALGFTSGFTGVLNKDFQEALHLSRAKSAGLQIAFYSAYAVGPLTYSGYCVRRFGYRISFMIGLCILGVGALLFWPSGHLHSFESFCGAMFVVGSGVATIETAAIPFVSICGPQKWSDLRLNFVQGIQSLCAVCALLIASYKILGGNSPQSNSGSSPLASVGWTYLGLAITALLLAVAAYFAPIPEISDEDLERELLFANNASQPAAKPFLKQYTLFWGLVASLCYHGAQAAIASLFLNYIVEMQPNVSDRLAAQIFAIALALYTAGRFVSSFALQYIEAQKLLLVSTLLVVCCLAGASALRENVGITFFVFEFYAKACIGPTTTTLSLRGLGQHTKRGASYLVASVASGIVFSPVTGSLADKVGTQKALVIPILAMAVCSTFPLYLNLRKDEEFQASMPNGAEEGVAEKGESREESTDSVERQV